MMIIQRFFRDSGSSFRTGSLLTWAVLGLEEFAFWMLTWLDSFAAATAVEAPAEALFLARTMIRMARPATATKVNTVMRAMFLFLVESSSVVAEVVVVVVVVVVVEAQAWSPWEVKGKLGS